MELIAFGVEFQQASSEDTCSQQKAPLSWQRGWVKAGRVQKVE